MRASIVRFVSDPELQAPQVFISYSHRDKKWLDRLQVHLAPLLQKGAVTVWADTQIRPGQEWKREIESAMASARIYAPTPIRLRLCQATGEVPFRNWMA